MNQESVQMLQEELSRRGQPSALSAALELLERHRITCDKDLPEMEFLFRIFGKPCFPRGELVAVTGKAKSGKTLFTSMLMANALSSHPSSVLPLTSDIGHLKVLWYDTEQSEQSTQDILKNRIFRMIDSSDISPQSSDISIPLDVFNVRSLHYEERLRLFEVAIQKYRPDIALLDGVRDLLADINDGVKAQYIVEHLMKLAQETNCCIVCVLHQNKGAEDRNLRGWIGTELMNKAFEVYSCEKVKPENIFVVEQTHTRKYDLGELMFFRVDTDTELPEPCEAPTRFAASGYFSQYASQSDKQSFMNREYLWFDENNKPHPKMNELFYEALKAGPLFYSDLQTRVMQLLNCGTQMWNNMFREMRDSGVIVRSKNHDGKAVWTLPTSKPAQPQQADMFDALASVSGDSPSS